MSNSSATGSVSGLLIKADIQGLSLIEFPDGPCADDNSCFKPASYDLRLGAQYVVPGKVEEGTGEPQIFDCRESGELFIEPFSSVVVSTYEIVRLPANVVGKFNLRIKQALRGLIVQMGTQVEPHYEGRLFALLQNVTAEKIKIKYKHLDYRLFTIEFYYTTADAEADATKVPVRTMETFLPAIRVESSFGVYGALKSELERHITTQEKSEGNIHTKIEEVRRNLTAKLNKELRESGPRYLAVYGVVLTFAVAGVITVLSPIVMKQVSDIPLADIRATTVSEAAKSISESVRSENGDIKESMKTVKESVKDVRDKADANDASLKEALKRISDLEKKLAAQPASVAPKGRTTLTGPSNNESKDR